jgi:Trypsin
MSTRSKILQALLLLGPVAFLPASSFPAGAVVGGESSERFADRVVMILVRGADKAGFCSGLVLDQRSVLTAAHCLRPLKDMAVHYRDASGAPVIVPIEAALAHPLYRADAIRARAVSIDVAIVRTAKPLDARFTGAKLDEGGGPAVGDPVILTGFGAAHEGDWKSGGQLRSLTLAVRAPASPVLVWAADPDGQVAGACSGDSGAPVWSADGATAVAIATWAQGPHGAGCGGLTQGPRLAPLEGWIIDTERRLSGRS